MQTYIGSNIALLFSALFVKRSYQQLYSKRDG